jgi:hypothetical protein
LKLSEAMKQGWEGLEQGTGKFQEFHRVGGKRVFDAACAIGAACLAVISSWILNIDEAICYFPELKDQLDPETIELGQEIARGHTSVYNPLCLKDAIIYYNDEAQLGKERIIDLVANLGY